MSINAPLQEQTRIEIKCLCQKMVDGELNFVEGTRQVLARSADAALNDNDPDLLVFRGIISETDEVSGPQTVKMWNTEAAAKHAPNWDRLEKWAKGYGIAACRNLISRLHPPA
jgi:hypothetical protein